MFLKTIQMSDPFHHSYSETLIRLPQLLLLKTQSLLLKVHSKTPDQFLMLTHKPYYIQTLRFGHPQFLDQILLTNMIIDLSQSFSPINQDNCFQLFNQKPSPVFDKPISLSLSKILKLTPDPSDNYFD